MRLPKPVSMQQWHVANKGRSKKSASPGLNASTVRRHTPFTSSFLGVTAEHLNGQRKVLNLHRAPSNNATVHRAWRSMASMTVLSLFPWDVHGVGVGIALFLALTSCVMKPSHVPRPSDSAKCHQQQGFLRRSRGSRSGWGRVRLFRLRSENRAENDTLPLSCPYLWGSLNIPFGMGAPL